MSETGTPEERITSLERRVAALETALAGRARSGVSPAPEDKHAAPLEIRVTNKRFSASDPEAGRYQDAVWFDCEFVATGLRAPARAVKGAIEFCDLFGTPYFRLGYTLNEPLQPGGRVRAQGVGFNFNEFMDEHRWMLGTELDDMTVRFAVATILYADGTRESGQ